MRSEANAVKSGFGDKCSAGHSDRLRRPLARQAMRTRMRSARLSRILTARQRLMLIATRLTDSARLRQKCQRSFRLLTEAVAVIVQAFARQGQQQIGQHPQQKPGAARRQIVRQSSEHGAVARDTKREAQGVTITL